MSTTVSPAAATEAATEATTGAAIGPARAGPALVLCAHGARGVAGTASRHAGVLRRTGAFDRVEACALFGEPRLEAALSPLRASPVTVVPFMLAEGWTLSALAERLRRCRPDARLCPPLGAHEAIADILLARALRGCRARGCPPAETALLLVGHGTTRHPASGATARRHAAAIAARGPFAEVATAFLDEAPSVAEAVAGLEAPRIAAVGFLTDVGSHGAGDVPRLLRETGRTGVYLGPIGPDPALAPLILAQAAGR
jgi:sirohydrochlorin cobaltochelatase